MEKKSPNWREEFKDFPKVPKSKIWLEDGDNTPEQLAVQKLIYGQKLSEKEKKELNEAIDFYEELTTHFKLFDLNTLDKEEFKKFKEYFNYAFNHLVFVKNDLYADEVVRLVRNKSILGKNERIRFQKDISYPPLSIVKEYNVYNRANTPDFNVFYACTCIDASLKEIKPEVGDLVTVGVWKIDNPEIPLLSYPICHNPEAISVNEYFKKGFDAFENLKNERNPLLMKFMEIIFRFLSDEYAKPINNPIDYYASALYSDRILSYDSDPDFKYDCIVYPSVGDSFTSDCLAIRPEVIDQRYKLSEVLEFKITKTDYTKTYNPNSRTDINLAEYENLESTDWIQDDGYIVW